MLILVENLQLHYSQLSNCAYYPGAIPGKKHALNKQYVLNSELRLLTCVYGMSHFIVLCLQTGPSQEISLCNGYSFSIS